MALNMAYEGRTFPPTDPYRVGREKIREFAEAIGVTDAAYSDPAAAQALGHPDVIAPPTFPILITMPATRLISDHPELGFDYARMVHGDQRFAYVRPIRAGDELVCVTRIDKLTSRAGLDSVSLRADIATTAGEPVVTTWSKLVARGGA
jgi:acyl dehydratase